MKLIIPLALPDSTRLSGFSTHSEAQLEHQLRKHQGQGEL